MTAERWFFDTNILVYLFDSATPQKQRQARNLWTRAVQEAEPILSTQVLQEFFVTVTKAVKQGLPVREARQSMQDFEALTEVRAVSPPLIYAATERVEQSGFSFRDSLIIETALDAGASRLFTEDMQDGQMFGNLEIKNPFSASYSP